MDTSDDTGKEGMVRTASAARSDQKEACPNDINSVALNFFKRYLEENRNFLDDSCLSSKKAYRSATELPDPSKPAYAEVNRTTTRFNLRLPDETLKGIDAAARVDGVSRTAWIRTVLEERLRQEAPAPRVDMAQSRDRKLG